MYDHTMFFNDQRIEDLVWKHDISYLEAVVMFCEERKIEPEVIAAQLSEQIKAKLKVEAINLRIIREPKAESLF